MVWPKAFRPILNPLAVIVYQCVRAGVALEKCCGDGLLADCVRSYARVGGVDDEERTLRARLGAWLGGTLSAGGVLGVIALGALAFLILVEHFIMKAKPTDLIDADAAAHGVADAKASSPSC